MWRSLRLGLLRSMGIDSDSPNTLHPSSVGAGLAVQNPDRVEAPRRAQVFVRLWLAFLMSRIMMGLMLLVMPWVVQMMRGQGMGSISWGAAAYLLLAVVQRWQWGSGPTLMFSQRLVGVCALLDVLAITALNHPALRVLNFFPLLALPLLYVAVLGQRLHALGAASAVSLLLLLELWHLEYVDDWSTQLLQAGLKGAAAMVGAWMVNLLATRLDEAIRHGEINQAAARTQVRINDLVLSEMTEGVLVADEKCWVRVANPAARNLLGCTGDDWPMVAWLQRPEMEPVRRFVEQSFVEQRPVKAETEVRTPAGHTLGLRLSSRLTTSMGPDRSEHFLCVVFMEDIRQVLARVRQEKMASMGRMSAAVAHEIRNPLAAIVQANALMLEELSDPRLQRMAEIVAQNARRIAQTVEDVLDVSRFPKVSEPMSVALVEQVQRVCEDWHRLHQVRLTLHHLPSLEGRRVLFDVEHLRRVLVNLLDNASRHASGEHRDEVMAIMDTVSTPQGQRPRLVLWNGGDPIDEAVAQHMFEPFFSSMARSSGLGLYICRQLCEAHQAEISFSRGPMPPSVAQAAEIDGNQFVLTFQWAPDLWPEPSSDPLFAPTMPVGGDLGDIRI